MIENHHNEQQVLNEPPKTVNYMLFLKAPNPGDDKKLKAEKTKFIALESQEEQQMREHINLLLREAEPLARIKMTINDANSLSEIMSVIR